MTRTLIVMRHAKSSWDAASQDDHERPLNKRGRRDAPRMGRWLKAQCPVIDKILVSDAARTRETIEAVLKARGQCEDYETCPSLYLASPSEMLGVFSARVADESTVMLVAHNPGCEEIVHWLSGDYHPMPHRSHSGH